MDTEERIKELEKKWEEKLEKVEAELLEQEHRPLRLLWNFWNRKKIWKNPDDHRRAATKKALLWRLFFSPTTIALGSGGLVAVLTLMFLSRQTDAIENQTTILDQQTKLLEASRRSSQVFIMGEVLSDVHMELENPLNAKRTLSSAIIGRIIAVSRSMKPYYYLVDDSLINWPISPERGQLMISLLESSIDSTTLSYILSEASFDFSELSFYAFDGDDMSEVDLSGSDLSDSEFRNLTIDKGMYTATNFEDSEFYKVLIHDSGFSETRLGAVEFTAVTMEACIFIGADFSRTEFRESYLTNSGCFGCDFSEAVFDEQTTIVNSRYTECNFTKADFRGIRLRDVEFKNCRMDSLLVDRFDWFEHMATTGGVRNIKELNRYYRLDSVHWESNNYGFEAGYYPTLLKRNLLGPL